MKAVDVAQAYKMVKKVVSDLKVLRSNSDSEFKKRFAKATKTGKDLHGEQFQLATPRLSGRQVYRSNLPLSTPEIIIGFAYTMNSLRMSFLGFRRALSTTHHSLW